MRLKRLDLTRYGKFTEHSIDFGELEPDQTDLHIVYGPNEAGKSTALAAFLDVLFGIEQRSRFNFVHPYNAMQVGASLEFAGIVREFVRVKRERNSLLDRDKNPVGEAAISGQLGGIDRDSYRAMFSLDDDTLEAGGESILASKGDLGELLFSASTGLADIGRTLVDLRAEADGFYRYHARTGELANLKVRLGELREQRDRIDTAASKYAQLVEDRDRAQSQYDEAIASRRSIQIRMEEIRRQVSALPRLAALRTVRERLRPLAELPAAPAGWPEALPLLQRNDVEIEVQSGAVDDDVTQREAELDALIVDEAALQVAERVDGLGDLHARYLTAGKDIPDRLLEVRKDDLAIAGILGRIGRPGEPDPERFVLGTSAVGILLDLIEKRSGLDSATQSAANELSMARNALEEAQTRLQSVDGGARPDDNRLSAVAAALASLRDADYAARRRLAKRSRASLLEDLTDRLRALHPWSGDIEQLAALPIPEPGIIEHWRSTLTSAQNEYDKLENDVVRLRAVRMRLVSERDAISGTAGIVTDQDAADLRAAREASWALHRRTLDSESADFFEAALRRDDIVMNARLKHEADVAKLHQTSRDLALAEAEFRIKDESLAEAAAKLKSRRDDIEAAVATLSLCGASVAQLETWLLKRTQALETRAALRKVERDLRDAETDSQAARERLTKALDAAGLKYDATTDIDEISVIAQAALEREAELKRLAVGVADRLHDLKMRERNVETALRNDRAWQAAWLESCSNCWLGESNPPPLVTTVREILSALTELGPALERRASLLDRVAKMRDDQRAFACEVEAIASALSCGVGNEAPLDLARSITDRIRQARFTLTTRDERTRELNAARERQRGLAETRAIHARRKAEMIDFFKVTSLAEVAVKLSDIERKAALESQAAEATREILDTLGLPSIEQAEVALDNADRVALEAEFAELKGRFDDQDQRTRDLFLAHGKAADQVEAVGGDAAVAKIEEQRRTILLEIEDRARRYLRLRAGIVAAEYALRAYRRHHRSSMMTHASEAFRAISRDAYSGLASQPNKENEILIAIAADGSSKIASELSKGTRFQLYLALRVAGYNEFARSHPPVPFIADDIMETFDDFRAEEAIRLLASMGQVGQVIYLTHHRHLCEIAQRVCPGVRVHEM